MQDAGKIEKGIDGSVSVETSYRLHIGIQTDQLTEVNQWHVVDTMLHRDILSSVCMVETAIQKV